MDDALDGAAFLGEMADLTVERAGQTRRNTKTVLILEGAIEGVPDLQLEIICKYVNKLEKEAQDFILMPTGTTNEEAQMIYDNACNVVRNLNTTNIGEIN